jgi:ribose transport system ATP-binding protein
MWNLGFLKIWGVFMFRLEMEGIYKSFGGVKALQNVGLKVKKGEVHAVIGENGAGKSTLMKILSGAIKKDSGSIKIDGIEKHFTVPKDAINAGISVIYQELNMAPHLTVAENIFLGDYPLKNGLIDWKAIYRKSQELLNDLGSNISPRETLSSLSVAQQQMVEIARSLKNKSKIVVFDEPSAVLGKKDSEVLFEIISKLKNDGVSILYISHRLDEILRITDHVTVLRDGKFIITSDTSKLEMSDLISFMTGKEYKEMWLERKAVREEGITALEVVDLCRAQSIKNVSFTVKKGEVVGLAGLVGSGRSEVARCIFGADKLDSGKIKLFGETKKISSPQDAIRNGIAFVTEDRKSEGLLLERSILENITITNLKKHAKWILINKKSERKSANDLKEKLHIKMSDLYASVKNLSGGNQQKVVLAKWLNIDPDILILDEPTRGVDVGAKTEIYQIIEDLKRQDKAVLLISSEFAEIMGLSDRIVLMDRGEMIGEYTREEAAQDSKFLESFGTGGKY